MAVDERQKQLWIHEFHLNGFIVLRGFLPLDFIDELHRQLEPLLRGEYSRAEETGWKAARGPARVAVHLESYARLLGGALADERYQRNPVVEELADAILGAGRWKRGWSLVEAVWKGSAFMTWHSDQKIDETPDLDAPHETLRLTYNIPLVDFTWASGAMEIIPGSHRLTRRFLASPDLLHIANIYPVRLELRRGDAVVRDGNALHRGTPNLLDDPRPMLDQTYKRSPTE